MKNLKNKFKNMNGITLIALVITIIVLLILAGVPIATLTGENGLLGKASTAKSENEKKTATEAINLKITNVQISKYTEAQRMPTLKELADNFCEDNDFEKVVEKTEVGSLTKISNENPTAIIAKLKAYPYEFEINSSLQLASIDGVKVATVPVNDDDTIVSMTKKELKKMIQDEIAAATPSTRETVVLYDGGKITTASATTTYNLSDSIENYTFIIIESVGGTDSNSWRCSDIFSVKEIVNSDEYHATIGKYGTRWCRLTFDEDSFCVPGLDQQYPIRILGIKI